MQELIDYFHMLMRNTDYTTRIIAQRSVDRHLATADRFAKDAEAMIAFGFVYGQWLQDFANQYRNAAVPMAENGQ